MENTSGYVYVMINPSMKGLVKIGKTTRSPEERAKELSSATGVAAPFIPVYHKYFDDCGWAESQIHKILTAKGYRVNYNREFFEVPTDVAINTIMALNDSTNQIIDEDNNNATFYHMGENYMDGSGGYMKDYDKALHYFKKSIDTKEPFSGDAWHMMSMIFEEQGKLQNAIECQLKAIESCAQEFGDDAKPLLLFDYKYLASLYARSKRIEDEYNCEKAWELFFECIEAAEAVNGEKLIISGCVDFLSLVLFSNKPYSKMQDALCVIKKYKSGIRQYLLEICSWAIDYPRLYQEEKRILRFLESL